MAAVSRTVTARLGVEVAAHRLQFDGAQLAAAGRLDALREALLAQSPSVLQRLRMALPWRPSDALQPPRGLYLWGGVGRGKTLLMDLFFTSLGDAAAERIHFYHFMRDVHAALADIKNQPEPLEIVAWQPAHGCSAWTNCSSPTSPTR
jgi:cell division protein ZapE